MRTVAAEGRTGSVRLPSAILRNRLCYTPVCLKENQEVHVPMRQRLDNGVQPAIQSDTQLPPIIVFGANATLKLRRAEALVEILEGVIVELYGPNMAVARLKSSEWALVAVIARPNDCPLVS
jgi:hypothetical protein